MPAQVFIRPTEITCGGNQEQAISVDLPVVRAGASEVVRFHNQLDGNVAAELKFFSPADKGGTAILGFCDEEPGDTFVVPGGPGGPKHRDCTLQYPDGDYAYTITAATYLDLDPIIIIEPTTVQSSVLYSAIIGAAVGAVIMYLLCRTFLGKNRQTS